MNIIPNLTVYSSRRGVAAQRNYGASSARYANIIFLDADMLLTPDFLQQISMKYECLKDFVAIPRLMAYDGKLLDTFFTYFGNLYISLNKKSRPILCGMCIITTKNVHDKLKGFDETLSYAEDIDYGQRAHELHIPYYIFSDILANSSTRRLQAISRTKLALLWLSWHIGAYRNGARNLQGRDEYTYGNFKKQ
jgi:glycosyltransferase involved in cell wall biosynthesis